MIRMVTIGGNLYAQYPHYRELINPGIDLNNYLIEQDEQPISMPI